MPTVCIENDLILMRGKVRGRATTADLLRQMRRPRARCGRGWSFGTSRETAHSRNRSLPKELSQRIKSLRSVGDDFDRRDEGYSQKRAGDSPQEPPDDHANQDGNRIEL